MPKARTATLLLSSGSPWSASCQDLRRSSDSRIRFGDRWSIQRHHHHHHHHHHHLHHPCPLLLLPLGLKHHDTHNATMPQEPIATGTSISFDWLKLEAGNKRPSRDWLVPASSPLEWIISTEGFPLICVHQFS